MFCLQTLETWHRCTRRLASYSLQYDSVRAGYHCRMDRLLSASTPTALRNNVQRSRWTLTWNNYDTNINYETFFRTSRHSIKRMILGFEIGDAEMTRHLQAYIEFTRTVRFNVVRRILPDAYWQPAEGSVKANYDYCSKSLNFFVIGNFDKELKMKNMAVGSIISGLLDPKCALQVQCSNEYAQKFAFFNQIVPKVEQMRVKENLFREWKKKNLYHWQDLVLRLLFQQDDRKVMWVWDEVGNKGKSFLAHYLSILYKFLLLDGTISSRDLPGIYSPASPGVCIDVCRSSRFNFDYAILESLKNGYLVTGKYEGKQMRFNPAKIIVFANFPPDKSNLSHDRWDIHQLGYGSLSQVTKSFAVIPLYLDYPFADEPLSPHLYEDFEVRRYLEKHGHVKYSVVNRNRCPYHVHNGEGFFFYVYIANCYRDIKCSVKRMKLC